MTESLLGAVAPDVIKVMREAQQANSVAPVPPEVEQLLQTPDAAPDAESPAPPSGDAMRAMPEELDELPPPPEKPASDEVLPGLTKE